jgi:hypothetical protein
MINQRATDLSVHFALAAEVVARAGADAFAGGREAALAPVVAEVGGTSLALAAAALHIAGPGVAQSRRARAAERAEDVGAGGARVAVVEFGADALVEVGDGRHGARHLVHPDGAVAHVVVAPRDGAQQVALHVVPNRRPHAFGRLGQLKRHVGHQGWAGGERVHAGAHEVVRERRHPHRGVELQIQNQVQKSKPMIRLHLDLHSK